MNKSKTYIFFLLLLSTILLDFNNLSSSVIGMLPEKSGTQLIHDKPGKSAINGTIFDNSIVTLRSLQHTKVKSDSAETQNSIKVWENSTGDVLITLALKDKNQRIKITVWNMLGKIVINDFEGEYKILENEHILKNSSSLMRGAYLVRVQGDKCKLDGKFIKTK